MLRNYLKTALFNLFKTPQVAVINILGLAIGMTACLVILHYVNYEKSYDKFYKNSDKIYRLRYERTSESGENVSFASCCPPAALRIRSQFPEVEKVARIFRYTGTVSHNENSFIEERMFFAESEFFEIFDFQFIQGNPVSGIKLPNTAFISKSTSQKYFGTQNPIGQTISVDKKAVYQIVGVFEDVLANSHVKFDILLSYPNLLNIYGADIEDSWGDTGAFTYLMFKKGANIGEFEKKLAQVVDKEFGEVLKEYKLTMSLPLQPLQKIHLTSHFMQEYEINGDESIVNLLFTIAIFIIVIAWLNYINISTARSLTRAKEVGIRKVIGATRKQLVIQFFIEIAIVNALAICLALFFVEISLPVFVQITEIQIISNIWQQRWFWVTIATLYVSGIFLSGFYPVFAMTSFKPIQVLRGKLGTKATGFNLRKVLVIFQFVMAIVLITCTFAVLKQLEFLKNKKLGFSAKQVLVVRAPRVRDANFKSNLSAFRQEILKTAGVDKFCVATEVPGRQILWDAGGIQPVGSKDSKNYQIVGIDYDFVPMFETTILEGRNFSKEFLSDTAALILNETAVKWMGFADNKTAIGKRIDYWGDIYTVVGVMNDFHQQSPKAAFEPHIYRLLPYGRGVRGVFAIKLNTSNSKKIVNIIQKQYSSFFPTNAWDYFFLDEYYDKQYKSEKLLSKVFGIFSLLALFVTMMGILGLFSFMVIQRTKEICIRIILGAGIFNTIMLFAKEYILLLLISFTISFPICYISINYWLQSFASKMNFDFKLFFVPFLFVFIVAAITISTQIFKAIRQNPVQSLRYE